MGNSGDRSNWTEIPSLAYQESPSCPPGSSSLSEHIDGCQEGGGAVAAIALVQLGAAVTQQDTGLFVCRLRFGTYKLPLGRETQLS